MRYPVLIEAGDERTAWGVVVPDLPGCFSAADTLEEALSAAEEAALAWIDAALDDGRSMLSTTSTSPANPSSRLKCTPWVMSKPVDSSVGLDERYGAGPLGL